MPMCQSIVMVMLARQSRVEAQVLIRGCADGGMHKIKLIYKPRLLQTNHRPRLLERLDRFIFNSCPGIGDASGLYLFC